MTDKELDEAIKFIGVIFDEQKPTKLPSLSELAVIKLHKAARELQTLRKGEHPDMVLVPLNVVRFLRGEGELDGMRFGEFPDNGEKYKRHYWWRRYLTAARKDGV